jgi:hypothetical protein
MAENQGFKVDGGKCPAYLKQSKTAVSSYSILPSTGALKTGLVSTSLGWLLLTLSLLLLWHLFAVSTPFG